MDSPLTCCVKLGPDLSVSVDAVIDTGATISCISNRLCSRLSESIPMTYLPTSNSKQLTMADGKSIMARIVQFFICIPTPLALASSVSLDWCFAVLPDDSREMLLVGMDLLRDVGLVAQDKIILPVDRSDNDDDGLDDVIEHALGSAFVDHASVNAASVPLASNGVSEDSTLDAEIARIVIPASCPVADKIRQTLYKHKVCFASTVPAEGLKFTPMKIVLNKNRIVKIRVRPLRP